MDSFYLQQHVLLIYWQGPLESSMHVVGLTNSIAISNTDVVSIGIISLRELCSNFPLLFNSEFLSRPFHYDMFYSVYAAASVTVPCI